MRAINKAPIVNAKKAVVIHITDKDAREGSKRDPSLCAAALAAKHIPECTEARIHIHTSYLKRRNQWERFRTPNALRTEIISFDRGAQFQPGDYRLIPIRPSRQATGKRQGGRDRPPKSVRQRRSRPAPHQVTGIRSRPDLDNM